MPIFFFFLNAHSFNDHLCIPMLLNLSLQPDHSYEEILLIQLAADSKYKTIANSVYLTTNSWMFLHLPFYYAFIPNLVSSV